MNTIDNQKEAVTKAARVVADTTVAAGTRAVELGTSTVKTVNESTVAARAREFGSSAASTVTDTAKSIFEKAQSVTGKGVEKVSDLPLGDKKVGERAQSTVDTVQEKIDVEQIQDQMAKLRDQIEGVLGTWKDSFRPSTPVTGESAPVQEPETKVPTAKKTTTAKTSAAKKATEPKASTAKKTATAKASTAKKTAKPKASK
ncbi:MAG: hypothetical protein BMS9Abin20_0843 [Acidimicrobiia bacterium]|nr:MAG: hypothetical protein BMS9Abin20_0843 [Acidimicrobiia bacterium]